MEPLSDPVNDRSVKTVRPPPHKPLSQNLMWPTKNGITKPDWKVIRDHLTKEGRIEKEDLLKLVAQCNKIMRSEGNLLSVQDPVTVIGDIHGQYYDLLKILEIGGSLDNTKYLFLGDFVDRGSFSIEVLILLYAIKINFPETIYFLRGNHECRQMTSFFNFRDECKYKYDQEIYDLLMDSFDLMPLSCIVNGKFLALHGGISPELRTIEDIKKIDRFKEPPRQGLFCDILWSDPVDNDDGICENVYRSNDVRGCSYFYGNDAVRRFLENNNLISVIRAHEAQLDGYKMHRWNGGNDFPVVITIFSAPNYCDVYNNKGAVIKFENNTLNIQQFNYTQHPYLLPNFMDIFTWSIPFVAEKITEMLYVIIKQDDSANSDDDLDVNEIKQLENYQKLNKQQTEAVNTDNDGVKKADVLRNKIKFVSKMMKMQKILRQESETIVKLKGQCPDNKIPKGLLSDTSTLNDSRYNQ
ncbi:ser thr protein phosphatase family protein, putative [Ichthyophthirius multifiliis]|uniref:Serine/threonine-protein phosphatase n=1 Tax=Ichthyophthirius multifiliis TaxID=5932 RepID=G0QZY1_ICHMU|nr:ser thr protein phosphatase family protein, putative [Ichthyophthirius multifiliis]EGR29243.1 ser thr protein phosphatase family protein, putative [Ichthyophthirius multifiliis]|eukprot:XP_004030479.1 ser thr protein phosphatase family protein, putative [Ichthyophthirius multifiliis]